MAPTDHHRNDQPDTLKKPFGTATKAIRDILGEQFKECNSPSLRLEKFVVLEADGKKHEEIQNICNCIEDYNKNQDAIPIFNLSKVIPGTNKLIMKLQSRLIVNQAGGVLENAGLCLHPHCGCPMIPGSAVKGVARAAVIQEIHDAKSDDEKSRLLTEAALVFGWCSQDWSDRKDKNGSFTPDFRYAAGDTWKSVWNAACRPLLKIVPHEKKKIDERKPWESLGDFGGLVVFLPAFPVEGSAINVVPDVVNCHHPAYYRGDRTKADDTENPIPNFFPAVEAGSSFEFAVAPVRGKRFDKSREDIKDIEEFNAFDPVKTALAWLESGLSTHGAGAKTNAGYGWFERDTEAEEKRRQEEESARKAAEEAEAARREEERKAALSPEERAVEEYEASLPKKNPTGSLKGDMGNIGGLPEERQRVLLHYLLLKENGRKIWADDVEEAKKRDKAFKRVTAVREAARKLGVEL